ncbi:MAG: hypothetical protein WBA42_01795 [Mesorhizobium sp.]
MALQPAYDGITLALGGNTVRMRPSLRAASILERLHDGFAALFRQIDEFHLGTIREIITITATDRQEASAFLSGIDRTPLQIVADTVTAPILALCSAFIPASDPNAKPASNAKPMPWPEVYRELFRTATGWLLWTPEAAWNATPTEINEAFAGHTAMLKAIHGSADDSTKPDFDPLEQVTPEQAKEGIARLKALARAS